QRDRRSSAERIETRLSKLPNASVSQQLRTIRVNATNLVSSVQLQVTWPVELPIVGLSLLSNRPLPYGNQAVIAFTAQNGSAFKIDSYYDARRVYDSLVQVSNNGPPISGQVQLNLTYLSSVGIFVFNMTADNYISLSTSLVTSNLEIQYPVDGFRVTGYNHSMLKRPQNVTDSIKFHICIDKNVRDLQPPSRVSYSINFGDGSPTLGPFSVTCVESNQPAGQVFCPNIQANQVFCQETVAYVYPVPGVFNVTLNLSNEVSSDDQYTMHTVYSQVSNVWGVFQLHPGYSGDSQKETASLTSYFAMEMPVLMLAQMQFGVTPNIWYEWNFGDGSSLQTTFNVPLMNHTYSKPGNYNVTVTAYNPESRLTASKLIYIFQSVSGVTLSSAMPYPMLTEYRVIVTALTMGTEACYLIDFTSWTESHMSLVRQTKESRTVFGDATYCAATEPYKSYISEYWNTDAASVYTTAYGNYIAGTGPASLSITILKNITVYGVRPITVQASNKVSTFTSNWDMTSARGYCYPPKARLDQNIQKTFKRGEDVVINAKQVINCYNSSAQLKWSVEVLNGSVWVSYQSELISFFDRFKDTVNKQPYEYYTQGIYFPEKRLGLQLIQLRLPKYSLKHFSGTGTTYRITLEIIMIEEPSLGSNNSLEITLEPADLNPVIQASFMNGGVWYTAESPAQFQYKSPLKLSCAASTDPDIFLEGGETQDLECEWYCYRSCESRLVLNGENLAYDKDSQSHGAMCDQFSLEGTMVTQLGCFARNTLRDRNYMPKVSLDDWKVTRSLVTNPASLNSLNSVVSFVYNGSQFTETWLNDIEKNNVTNYLYAMNSSTDVIVDTANMFELQEHFMVLVVRDKRGVKKPKRTLFQMKLTRGMPPMVSFSCVSNCNQAKMKGLMSGINACNQPVIKIDGKTAFKLQTQILDYNPAATYSYRWWMSSISNPFDKCPDDLTEQEVLESFASRMRIRAAVLGALLTAV
uniref:PKD domain-containing protein n=1 Tax=Macrostomum lignano TaxID=282301 RepID=A0A1I8H6Q7_9PLAT